MIITKTTRNGTYSSLKAISLFVVITKILYLNISATKGEEITDKVSNKAEESDKGKCLSVNKKIANQNQAIKPPHQLIYQLCSNYGERKYITQEGQQHIFRKSAMAVHRCDNGKIWKASENGMVIPEPTTFYFDETGRLLDICEPLFWRSGCVIFEHISCDKKNYCNDK